MEKQFQKITSVLMKQICIVLCVSLENHIAVSLWTIWMSVEKMLDIYTNKYISECNILAAVVDFMQLLDQNCIHMYIYII